jgi:hypothetical protein
MCVPVIVHLPVHRLTSSVQESLVHVGLHCGWDTHVRPQAILRFTCRPKRQERTVTATSVPANNRLTGNRQSDTRRNLYVLGLPFDLAKYVLSLME